MSGRFMVSVLCLVVWIQSIQSTTTPTGNNTTQISAMEEHQVVKDVIDTVPPHVAEVKYDSGVEVKLGNVLTPTQVKNMPTVKWPTEPNTLYTLAFSDPDAPSRKEPTLREFKHWLVINIPGDCVEKGDTLVEYIGSGPPKDTGLHRYVLVIYKQPNRITTDSKKTTKFSREGRVQFKVRDFAKTYQLGEPIAANFFQAQYDDYVPILHAQLSDSKTN